MRKSSFPYADKNILAVSSTALTSRQPSADGASEVYSVCLLRLWLERNWSVASASPHVRSFRSLWVLNIIQKSVSYSNLKWQTVNYTLGQRIFLYESHVKEKAVPWSRWLGAILSLRKPGLAPMSAHVAFVAENWHWDRFCWFDSHYSFQAYWTTWTPSQLTLSISLHIDISCCLDVHVDGVRRCVETAATKGPIVHPPSNIWVWTATVELWRENQRTQRKTYACATSSTTNSIWTDPGTNQGLRGDRPASNRLSHGMATI
jgi:hypothetical protein